MLFENDTAILEDARDLGDARVFLSHGIDADFHTLPVSVDSYPHQLPQFTGKLLIDKLRNGAKTDKVNLHDRWAAEAKQQASIIDDPA